MNKTGTVYKLTFPNAKSYIGITVRNLGLRINAHINSAKNGSNYAVHKAIRKYGENSFAIEVIAIGLPEELPNLEIEAIKKYQTFGENGYNLTAGGEGTLGRTFSVSDETKAKISKTTKGRPGKCLSDETKRKLRDANLGKKHSQETLRKISESLVGKQKGKVLSEETRMKISNALTGIKFTEERRINQARSREGKAVGMSGKSHSEQTKQKISLNRKGKRIDYRHSEETRKKISEGNIGKVMSEEARKKMSEAAKKRWTKDSLLGH